MKLLVVAGGGGHFTAALAVIEALPKEWEVLVIGRKYAFEGEKAISLESQTAKKLGLPFVPITTGRLQRTLTKYTLSSLAKVPVGFWQSLQIIKRYKPDVLVSFGGYVSVPVAFAAKALGVPIIVHEQTLAAGLANKVVGKFAEKIAISWEKSARFFPKEKVVLTGNPIRAYRHSGEHSDSRIQNKIDSGRAPLSLARMTEEKFDKKQKIIYITGGSAGSHAINVLIEGCIGQLVQKYTVIHQTGAAKEFGDFVRMQKLKGRLPKSVQGRYLLHKFISSSDVYAILQKADLVVARSGIGTVTELLSFGKPAFFIPLPYGQHNEQLKNALFVKKLGLAEVGDQKLLTPELLLTAIEKMITHAPVYKKNSKQAQEMIQPHAAQNIISLITDVSN